MDREPKEIKKPLSMKEAALFLGVCEWTLRMWIIEKKNHPVFRRNGWKYEFDEEVLEKFRKERNKREYEFEVDLTVDIGF